MTSSGLRAALLHTPTNGGRSKRVTFANTGISILIRSEIPISPQNARDRIRAVRARRATPHKGSSSREDISSSSSLAAASMASATSAGGGATTQREKRTPRLVESGAVRVQIARHTNTRRGAKHGSDRLVDSGAVRLNVTRHTTPRRLYATHGRIWSPPPPSSSRKRVPRSEQMTGRGPTTTPLRQSNAHVGGHQFLAMLSPKYTTPVIRAVTYDESDKRHVCLESERGLSRTLFD